MHLYPALFTVGLYLTASIVSGDEDEVKERETKQEYNLLCDWIKQQLGDKVAKVQVSKRLSSSPCVLVSGKFGWSANMERSADYSFYLVLHNTLDEVYFHFLSPVCRQSVFELLFVYKQIDESSDTWGHL